LSGQENRYLLQHAGDPVAWQLWSPAALALARVQDKPIFLSIGYSACNSCQLMQSESFSDPAIAAQLNDNFINIKVDKEERPDLDDIFQTAHQLLNGQTGGWPLSVFLCPKTLLPFVVGTYFPREPLEGRIPFCDLLIRVVNFYRAQHKDFLNLREQMGKSFKALNDLPS
ncbi:thioredoxin domain-containing protein, partial [Halorubrum tibetense]